MRLALATALLFACSADSLDTSPDAPVDALDAAASSEDELVDPGMVIDFGSADDTSWIAVNDTVMGGVSEGDVDYTDSSFIFEGTVSTDNNGGFTSVRSTTETWDLSGFDTITVHLSSAGQGFDLVMDDNDAWWDGEYRHPVTVDDDGWTVVEINLADFEYFDMSTGYPEASGERFRRPDRKNVVSMQFMSELFVDGDFRLEVDRIEFR
jgi:hypothetical protein